MIARIPRITGAATSAQINTVLDAIERELSTRPVMVEGAVLIGQDQTLVLQAPNGSLHRVVVDADGNLSTTPQRNRRVQP